MNPWRKACFVITVAVLTCSCPPCGPGPLHSGASPWEGLVPDSAVSVVPSAMGQLFISELSTSSLQAVRERSLERHFFNSSTLFLFILAVQYRICVVTACLWIQNSKLFNIETFENTLDLYPSRIFLRLSNILDQSLSHQDAGMERQQKMTED